LPLCSLASLLRLISTFSVEMIQTSARDLRLFLTHQSLFHDSMQSRGTAHPLSYAHHLARSIYVTLVPIPNDISSHIPYDWFAFSSIASVYQSSSSCEFIPDHRSGHSSPF
jgi:hypothetical protein